MTLSRDWRLRLLVLLCSPPLIAAACTGDDAADGFAQTQATAVVAADGPVDGEPAEEAGDFDLDVIESTASGGVTAPEKEGTEEGEMKEPDRSAIEDVFEEAARRRASVVERIIAQIASGEWGVDDGHILRGPEGFMIDLNECPDDWSNNEGITDTEIRLGQIGPQSGRLASYGDASLGWLAYLDHVNAQGGIAGRDVVMQSRDDAEEAVETIELVNELISDDSVFSVHTVGSPSTLAAYGILNKECVPQPFVWSGHPAWGDPQGHPWTAGGVLSYSTEAVLWGSWIEANLADELPVVVAGLVIDHQLGSAYEQGFRRYAEDHPDVVSEFVFQRHDLAAVTVADEVTVLAASDPDVFISMTAGNACLLAIQAVAESGLRGELSAAFTPSMCKAPASWVAPAGDDGHGWLTVGGGVKDITDPALIGNDAFIDFAIERLRANDLDPTVSTFGDGFMLAYPYVEALRIGAELPGGLNRTNFILAVRAIDIHHPMLLDGISFAMNGNADAFPVEGSEFSQYDSSSHSWFVSTVVDVNGGSPNCAWDADEGACR